MREKIIEQKLVKFVKSVGGLALKFVSPGTTGVPDRLILLPGARLAFVEVKAPGQKPRTLQLHRHDQLRNLGFKVFILDSVDQIKPLLENISPIESACEGGWRGEPLTTAGGGNLVRGEVSRNKRSPQCGAATIEAAGSKAPQVKEVMSNEVHTA